VYHCMSFYHFCSPLHYIVRVSFIYMILIIPLHCLCKLRQILIFTLIYLYFIFRHACIMWSVVLGVNSRTFIRDYLLVLFLRNAVNSVGVTSLEPDYPHYICLPVPTQVLNFQRFVSMRTVWRYQEGNHNPYIEEEQRIQWPNEKEQKNKQRSNNDL
jgi:hypothetical protein